MASTEQEVSVPPTPGLSEGEREFVHKVADHYRDTDNMAWEHGYLIGWLLISEPPEQSATQLTEVLGVSRAAVDHISRLLVPPAVLDRRELDDGDYALTMNPQVWPKNVQHALLSLPNFHAIMVHGLEALEGASEERRRRLVNMERFFRYLGTEIPAVFDRYTGPERRSTP